MKIIKAFLLILILWLTSSLYAQSKKTSFLNHKALVAVGVNNQAVGITTTFNKNNFLTRTSSLSIYNSNTGYNDNYYLVKDDYVYTSSKLVLENSQRGYKIDSFNPYGASNY